jgi:hypothetical protein
MAARPVQRRGTGRGIVRAHIQLLDDKRKPLDVLVKVPRPLPHVSSLQARTSVVGKQMTATKRTELSRQRAWPCPVYPVLASRSHVDDTGRVCSRTLTYSR